MKLFQLTEMKYAGQQPWFVLDDIGGRSENETKIIGPFQNKGAAQKYIDSLEQNFGDLMAFSTSVNSLITPEDYYEFAREHYEWMNED